MTRPPTIAQLRNLADRAATGLTPDEQQRLRDGLARLEHAEAERDELRKRVRLAHQARRLKEHQLDGIRRALCDIGVIQDDDPYSHADLEDVIRQLGHPDEQRASEPAALDVRPADDTTPAEPAPAHDGGPSVAECRDVDRRWPLQKTGE